MPDTEREGHQAPCGADPAMEAPGASPGASPLHCPYCGRAYTEEEQDAGVSVCDDCSDQFEMRDTW